LWSSDRLCIDISILSHQVYSTFHFFEFFQHLVVFSVTISNNRAFSLQLMFQFDYTLVHLGIHSFGWSIALIFDSVYATVYIIVFFSYLHHLRYVWRLNDISGDSYNESRLANVTLLYLLFSQLRLNCEGLSLYRISKTQFTFGVYTDDTWLIIFLVNY